MSLRDANSMVGSINKHGLGLQVKVRVMHQEANKLGLQCEPEADPAPAFAHNVPQGLLQLLPHEQEVWNDPKHNLTQTFEEHMSVLYSLYYYERDEF